jgi:hypothetical protein
VGRGPGRGLDYHPERRANVSAFGGNQFVPILEWPLCRGTLAIRQAPVTRPPITVSKTATAIVDSAAPLALVLGKDGRYRLEERVVDGMASVGRVGVWPRDAHGHRGVNVFDEAS